MTNIVSVYCIFDSKGEIYNVPFCSPNAGTARRMFGMNVNEAGSMINAHAEDFVLFEVGTFNCETGELLGCVPKSVCVGVDVRRVE